MAISVAINTGQNGLVLVFFRRHALRNFGVGVDTGVSCIIIITGLRGVCLHRRVGVVKSATEVRQLSTSLGVFGTLVETHIPPVVRYIILTVPI